MIALRKMLVVANTDWFLANFMSAFLSRHTQAGVEVVAASPGGPYIHDIRRAGLGWVEIPMSRGRGSARGNLASISAIRRLLREVQPDLAHFVTAKAVVLGDLAMPADDRRRAINVLPGLGHAFVTRGLTGAIDRSVMRWGVRRAAVRPQSLMVFHQEADRQMMLGASGQLRRASRIIPGWGVDLTRFTLVGRGQHPPLVVMVSRMLWSKGVAEFVEAARLCRESTDARFILVGDPDPGNPGPVPPPQLQAWQRSGAVEWWGHRDDIPEILSQASLVVLPSMYGEGVPQSLIEASAARLPVVASDVPGCREIVKDGVNGLLVQPGAIVELAGAIRSLLADPTLRAEMGRRGREIAQERFSIPGILAQYVSAYRELGLATELEADRD